MIIGSKSTYLTIQYKNISLNDYKIFYATNWSLS